MVTSRGLSAKIYCTLGVLALLSPEISGQKSATPQKLRLRGADGVSSTDKENVESVGEEWKSMLDIEREDGTFWQRELQGSLPTVCNGLTEEQRRNQITATIADSGVSDKKDLADRNSPQGQALDWLINDDERFLCPKDKNLIQRYIMAVFYYSTEGDKWNECSAEKNKDKDKDKEKDKEDKDKEKEKDDKEKDKDKDKDKEKEKKGNRVWDDMLNRSNDNDSSDDGDERICNTRKERQCYKPCKERNKCKSGDRSCLQKCRKKCCGLKLNKRGSSDSRDGGRSDISKRNRSRLLQADKEKDKEDGKNMGICGGPNSAFPGKNPYLSESSECDWAGSKCDGGESMIEIGFEQNNLAGTFPSEFFALNKLRNLTLEGGQTSGRIPSEWGDMESIQIMDVDSNRLTGPIPENLFNLNRLKVLDIDENQLTGTLSKSVGKLKQLVFVEFEENNFRGKIPNEFGNLKNLRTATFRANDFTGTMPQSVCDNRKDKLLTLTADCAGDPPQIECDCCTACFQ